MKKRLSALLVIGMAWTLARVGAGQARGQAGGQTCGRRGEEGTAEARAVGDAALDRHRRRPGRVHRDGRHAHRPQRQGRAVGEHGLRRLREEGLERPPADHVRLQRRPRLLLDVAPHGRARSPPRRDRRRRPHAAAALPGRGQRLQHPRQDRPRDDRPGRHGPLEGRRRREGQGLLGLGPRHRFDRALHPAVRQRQRPVELAQVHARRELRDHARSRHHRPPRGQGHGVQRRHPRVGCHGSRRAVRLFRQRPAVSPDPAVVRRRVRVPQDAPDAPAEPRRRS